MFKHNFRVKTFTILAFFILIQVISACKFPGFASDEASDLQSTETALAETLQAMNAATDTPVPTDTLVPSATLPGEPPPAPATTQAGAPPPVAATTVVPPLPPTAGQPTIKADIDTNCRQGPSTLYAVLGYLLVGQTSIVAGRHASLNSWWYIENPKKPGNYCWVWGETTRVEGDTSLLPIITPPPPPTLTPTSGAPSITAVFSNVHNCGGTPTAIFMITNTGSSTIESVNMTIKDLDTNTVVYQQGSNSPFFNSANGCPPGGPSLAPGASAFVGAAIGPIPVGHTLRMTASLCTGDDLTGSCLNYQFDFGMP